MATDANPASPPWAPSDTGTCPATRPEGCWQAPLEGAARLSQSLSPERRLLLQTSGLLVIRMVVPPPAECDTLIWLRPPPNDVADDDWQWYIDGSLLDEPRRFARRTGFAIVVVDSCTGQVAFGYGWPPAWVETAAAAEAWAYSFVVGLTPMAPAITTDCLKVLKTLSAGKMVAIAATIAATHRLARVWARTFGILEEQGSQAAAKLTWMPAHGSSATIGVATKSNGHTISGLDWRANRLVDALAKAAAAFDRVLPWIAQKVWESGQLAEHAAASLGVVTHAANMHNVQAQRPEGTSVTRTFQDSRPPPRAEPRRMCTEDPEALLETALGPLAAASARGAKRSTQECGGRPTVAQRRAASTATQIQDRVDAEQVAKWLEARVLQPRSGASAGDRMQAIRERLCDKRF